MGFSLEEFNESKRQFDEGIDLQNDQLETAILQFNAQLDEDRRFAGEKDLLAARGLTLSEDELNQRAKEFALNNNLDQAQFAEAQLQFQVGTAITNREYVEKVRQFNAQIGETVRSSMVQEHIALRGVMLGEAEL